ncbi:MAG TPA: hypothetical protein VHF23_09095 [Gaiellaceae bacterium]|nr:hypothetical protein [Gaiellaceae bacterium]
MSMAWTREELDERVEELADAHEGDEFIAAVARFAKEELAADERDVLGQILLQRADEEHLFRETVRRRAREHGWWRRTARRLEDLLDRDDVGGTTERVAAVVARGDAGELAAVVAELRADRGRAVRVLDELSRHADPGIRRWVSAAARDVLEDGGVYVVMGLTRDRDRRVRESAVADLVVLDPDAARRLVPSLRRRLRSRDPAEAATAMWTLAELRDEGALPRVRRLAEGRRPGDEPVRRTAEVVSVVLGGRPAEIFERIRAHEHDFMPDLARAARLVGGDEARAVLAESAAGAPDAECRAACRAELEALAEPSA